MADTADSPITLTLPRSVFEGIAAALEANRPPKRPVRLGLLKALVGASGGMLDFEKLTESTTTKTQVASIEGVENAPARTVIHEDIHQEHHCSTIPRLPLPTSTARAAIVIVGCGEIARNYVHSILHAPDFVITAVCDPDVASATALASIINAHQALVYSPIQPCFVAKSLDEVLEIHASQRRIAVNLTPTHLHYSTTTKLLVGGCNVWSEKPLAETVEEAQKLLGLAADRSLELGCSPVTFWGAAQQTVSEQVRNGALGPVRLCTASVLCGSWMSMDDRLGGWRAHRRYQVGSLRDVAVYPFALLTSLFGPALAISARAAGRASLHHSQTETAELNARQSQSSSPQKASDLESSALDPTHNVPWAGVDGGKENVDLWTITIDLAGGITVLITSSLSLSAPAASDAYTLTIRGDKGIISLDSLWNGGANITFIQEGGLEEAGRPQSLSLWMPHAEHPNAPPHPHSCDWSLGLKLLASSIDARMCAVDDPSMSTHELPRDSPPLPNRTFTGDHGLHIVDMLQQAEKSADAPDHPALPLTTKFQWPPPMPPQSQICSVKFCGHQMSMLIFGTMRLANVTQPLDLLDAAWNCGCNTFDMGHVYGPKVEGILGKWLSSRIGTGRGSFLRPPAPGRTLTRSDVILIAKGGHPFRESKEGARLKQEDLSRDLDESLERLHTDYVDVFLLHRDDPKAFPKVCCPLISEPATKRLMNSRICH